MTVHESSEFEFRAGGGRDVVFMERLRGLAQEVRICVRIWWGGGSYTIRAGQGSGSI